MSDPAWFHTRASRAVYEGFSTVRIDTVVTPSGDEMEREIVIHTDAVAIVPVTAAGEVVLLRQYRQPVERYLLEVPAGKMDVPDEPPEVTAARELHEEVHHTAERWDHLVTFHNSAGWTTERTHVFLARDLHEVEPPDDFQPHGEEADMEVVVVPFAAALDRVHRGGLTDAKTVIGLLLAAAKLEPAPGHARDITG